MANRFDGGAGIYTNGSKDTDEVVSIGNGKLALHYGVVYAARTFETTFIEAIVRDRFAQKNRRKVPYGDEISL